MNLGPFSSNHRGCSQKTKDEACLDLSLVVPVCNEKNNLEELNQDLLSVVTAMGVSFEIIYIDDGSVDGSLGVLKSLAASCDVVNVIVFRRNYGQTAALAAGFKIARGDIVVAIDADLQNDPRDIPLLMERIGNGADVVSGWRKERKDETLKRKIPSMIANRIINRLISGTGVYLHDYGCTLKAYRREVLEHLKLYGDMHRFIPAFAAWLGVRVDEVQVRHHPRRSGRSKYGLARVPEVLLDFITVRFFGDYLTKPIRFFGKVAGLFLAFGGMLCALVILGSVVAGRSISLNALLLIFLCTLIMCVQSIFLGLLGEMHMRSYFEHQGKDPYVIKEIIHGAHANLRISGLSKRRPLKTITDCFLEKGSAVAEERSSDRTRFRRST